MLKHDRGKQAQPMLAALLQALGENVADFAVGVHAEARGPTAGSIQPQGSMTVGQREELPD